MRNVVKELHVTGNQKFRLALFLIFLLLFFSACGITVRTQSLFGKKVRLNVEMTESANQNNPVAVDYVLVYDEDLLKELEKLPAREWFEQKDQYKRDYPEDSGFNSWNWEWVPGQKIEEKALPLEASAEGGIIYANYFSKGDHRARVDPHQSLNITLLEDSFVVDPQ